MLNSLSLDGTYDSTSSYSVKSFEVNNEGKMLEGTVFLNCEEREIVKTRFHDAGIGRFTEK